MLLDTHVKASVFSPSHPDYSSTKRTRTALAASWKKNNQERTSMTIRTKRMSAEVYSSKEWIIDTSQVCFRGKRVTKRGIVQVRLALAVPKRYMVVWNRRGREGCIQGRGFDWSGTEKRLEIEEGLGSYRTCIRNRQQSKGGCVSKQYLANLWISCSGGSQPNARGQEEASEAVLCFLQAEQATFLLFHVFTENFKSQSENNISLTDNRPWTRDRSHSTFFGQNFHISAQTEGAHERAYSVLEPRKLQVCRYSEDGVL